MLYLLSFLCLCSIAFWWIAPKEAKWLKQGTLLKRSKFAVNQRCYYMEGVKLPSYREAFGAYEKSIEEVCQYGEVIDIEYDLYDWTVSYVQFADITIGIKLYRPLNTIILAQSKLPMTIDTMQDDLLLYFNES